MKENHIIIDGDSVGVMVIRILLCVVFPPLAVFDKGCGAILLVLLLTCLGWIPGTIFALILCLKKNDPENSENQK